jgi:hypothetical protein
MPSIYWYIRELQLSQYALTVGYVLVQLILVRSRPRKSSRTQRPPSDPTWFVPVYLWGLQSLGHIYQFENGFWDHSDLTIVVYGEQYLLNFGVAALVLAGCFLSEHWARQRGWAARAPQATLPLGVVAAIIGVQAVWGLFLIAFTSV